MLIPSTEIALRTLLVHPRDEEMRPLVGALAARARRGAGLRVPSLHPGLVVLHHRLGHADAARAPMDGGGGRTGRAGARERREPRTAAAGGGGGSRPNARGTARAAGSGERHPRPPVAGLRAGGARSGVVGQRGGEDPRGRRPGHLAGAGQRRQPRRGGFAARRRGPRGRRAPRQPDGARRQGGAGHVRAGPAGPPTAARPPATRSVAASP